MESARLPVIWTKVEMARILVQFLRIVMEENIECVLVTHMDNFFVLFKYRKSGFFKAESPHSCQIHQQDSRIQSYSK